MIPSKCLVCHAPSPRAVLCRLCRTGLPWLFAGCARCGLPRCGPCPAAGRAFDVAWAPMKHEGIARDLLLALKLRGALPAADLMAAQMLGRAPPEVRALWADAEAPGGGDERGVREPLGADAGVGAGAARGGVVVVPVPGHPERVRRRGFDPAERIARAVARRSGWPVFDGLQREGTRTRQLGRGRARRAQRGGGGAVAVARDVPVGVIALLVDDVHTTGATLDACAQALKAAGFPQVAAVTYVRTLTES